MVQFYIQNCIIFVRTRDFCNVRMCWGCSQDCSSMRSHLGSLFTSLSDKCYFTNFLHIRIMKGIPSKKKKILESSSRNKWYPDNASSLSFVVLFVWWWINGQLTECSKKQEIDGKQPVEKQKVLLVPNKNTEWFCNLSN